MSLQPYKTSITAVIHNLGYQISKLANSGFRGCTIAIRLISESMTADECLYSKDLLLNLNLSDVTELVCTLLPSRTGQTVRRSGSSEGKLSASNSGMKGLSFHHPRRTSSVTISLISDFYALLKEFSLYGKDSAYSLHSRYVKYSLGIPSDGQPSTNSSYRVLYLTDTLKERSIPTRNLYNRQCFAMYSIYCLEYLF